MAITALISSLKKTTRLLKMTNRSILRHERTANKITDTGLVFLPRLMHTRAEFEGIIADVNNAVTVVNKYRAITQGVPLVWDEALVDKFTASMEEDSEVVVAEFMAKVAVGTGLEWYLRGQSNDEEGEGVADEEVFATYRVIGCQTYTDFEVGVQRAVRSVADKALELAVKVEAAGEKKKRRRKRSREEEGEAAEKKVKVEEEKKAKVEEEEKVKVEEEEKAKVEEK